VRKHFYYVAAFRMRDEEIGSFWHVRVTTAHEQSAYTLGHKEFRKLYPSDAYPLLNDYVFEETPHVMD
jgi:hypothetical protein